MKKILVPTDFSSCAAAAENYAFFLAKKVDASLVFLHVVHTPVDWSKVSKEQESLFPEAKANIANAKKKLKELIQKADSLGIQASKVLIYNNTNEKLHKYVEDDKIELVIMGSHGQYGFKEFILGSNTYSMLRRSNIPILVVKESNEKLTLDSFVVATNFKEKAGAAFKNIEQIAEMLQAKMKVVYVNTPTNFLETPDIVKIGKGFVKEYASYNHDIHIVDAFREERGILQFSEKVKADAIFVVTEGKSDLAQYFSPSITENLITMSNLPVISLRAR